MYFLDRIKSTLKGSYSQTNNLAGVHLLDTDLEPCQRFNFHQLAFAAHQVAEYLREEDLCGERVILMFPTSIEFVVALLGCFLADVVAVPLNIPFKQNDTRFKRVLLDSQATAILVNDASLPVFSFSHSIEKQETICGLPQPLSIHVGHFQLPQDQTKCKAEQAFIQYTSGSTSLPKGVMVSHANLEYNLSYIQTLLETCDDDVYLTWLPNFHDLGLIGGLLLPLQASRPLYLLPTELFIKKPITWLQAISKYRVTMSAAPNFAYDLCLKQSEHSTSLDLSCWRYAINTAEPVKAATLDAFCKKYQACGMQQNQFYTGFGLAEGTLVVTGITKEHAPKVKYINKQALSKHQIQTESADSPTAQSVVSCGRFIEQTKLVIVDENKHALPANHVGEVWITGPTVALGYWNKPEITAKTFQQHIKGQDNTTYLATGDLGFIDEYGELYLTGRIKEMIIINGANHYPQDIELASSHAHPMLKAHNLVAFAQENAERQTVLCLMVGLKQALDDEAYKDLSNAIVKTLFEREGLSLSCVCFYLDSLPKTTSGKIMRTACRKLLEQGSKKIHFVWQSEQVTIPESITSSLINQSSIEAWVLNYLSQSLSLVLTPKDLKRLVSDFALASVQVVDIFHALEDWLGCELPPTLFYQAKTLGQLAEAIHQAYREEHELIGV